MHRGDTMTNPMVTSMPKFSTAPSVKTRVGFSELQNSIILGGVAKAILYEAARTTLFEIIQNLYDSNMPPDKIKKLLLFTQPTIPRRLSLLVAAL
jgi:hypothetical protein